MDTELKEDSHYKKSTLKKDADKSLQDDSVPSSQPLLEQKDEDLSTLKKIHAILLNCINLDKKQKLEFCNSQRYFMKLYLKKLRDKLKIQ